MGNEKISKMPWKPAASPRHGDFGLKIGSMGVAASGRFAGAMQVDKRTWALVAWAVEAICFQGVGRSARRLKVRSEQGRRAVLTSAPERGRQATAEGSILCTPVTLKRWSTAR